jgi:predicted HD phosphohydrolase
MHSQCLASAKRAILTAPCPTATLRSMKNPKPERAAFRALSEATPNDWAIIDSAERGYRQTDGPGRGMLRMLASIADCEPLGTQINLYSHCLQTATRVLEAGHDDELVVAALFHDLPEAFSDNHHGLLAAQMLAPWLTERRSWLVIHHVEFQAFHFANHPTRDRNEREQFRDHPYFAETAQFCELYDQNSFDPDYRSLPLEEFEPIVRRFFDGPVPPIRQPPG